MIGFVERNGTEGEQYGYTSEKDAVQYTVIAFSSDGGATWTASTLPHTIPYPMIDALTCPTTRTCYGAGSDNIAQRIGNTYNGSSPVVAITHDAGRTWQRVTFAVPAKVSSAHSRTRASRSASPTRDRRPRPSTPTTADHAGCSGSSAAGRLPDGHGRRSLAVAAGSSMCVEEGYRQFRALDVGVVTEAGERNRWGTKPG